MLPAQRLLRQATLTTVDGEILRVKLLVLGDGTVGKSQLVIRYVESRFDPSFIVTIGVASLQKTAIYNGSLLKVQVWDAAGHDDLQTISPHYYRSADAVVLVYDITNRESFEHLEYWSQQLEEHGAFATPVIVIGNKIDSVDMNMITLRVPKDEEDRLAEQMGVPFFEVSAKTGQGVEDAFAVVVDLVLQQRFGQGGLQVRQPSKRASPLSRICSCLPFVHDYRPPSFKDYQPSTQCQFNPKKQDLSFETRESPANARDAVNFSEEDTYVRDASLLSPVAEDITPVACNDASTVGMPSSGMLAFDAIDEEEAEFEVGDTLTPVALRRGEAITEGLSPCQNVMTMWSKCCGSQARDGAGSKS